MKYLLSSVILAVSSPALAVTISNLDNVPHSVVIEEVQGSKVVRQVQPNQTIHAMNGVGKVYLMKQPEKAVQIEELDRLAIWPEGHLQIQMRRHTRGTGN